MNTLIRALVPLSLVVFPIAIIAGVISAELKRGSRRNNPSFSDMGKKTFRQVASTKIRTWVVDRSKEKERSRSNPLRASHERGKDDNPNFVVAHTYILTNKEKEAYRLLKEALPEHIILAQVDLKQILRLEKGDQGQYLDRLGKLSIDFVVLDQNLDLIVCFELNDKSHDRADVITRDNTKKRYLNQAGIRLIYCRELGNIKGIKRYVAKNANKEAQSKGLYCQWPPR